jgi:hypothetical protein
MLEFLGLDIEKRGFVDWYSARPFEIVQVDLKYIRDQKALTREQISYLDRYNIPNYQWSALDVCSWFKPTIVFTVNKGKKFGGKSWLKVRELRKLISGFGCRLIQNHKGHCEENTHLERSHRTDDDEFYIPRAMRIRSDADLLDKALGYIYYSNNLREHFSLGFQPLLFLSENAASRN